MDELNNLEIILALEAVWEHVQDIEERDKIEVSISSGNIPTEHWRTIYESTNEMIAVLMSEEYKGKISDVLLFIKCGALCELRDKARIKADVKVRFTVRYT